MFERGSMMTLSKKLLCDPCPLGLPAILAEAHIVGANVIFPPARCFLPYRVPTSQWRTLIDPRLTATAWCPPLSCFEYTRRRNGSKRVARVPRSECPLPSYESLWVLRTSATFSCPHAFCVFVFHLSPLHWHRSVRL